MKTLSFLCSKGRYETPSPETCSGYVGVMEAPTFLITSSDKQRERYTLAMKIRGHFMLVNRAKLKLSSSLRPHLSNRLPILISLRKLLIEAILIRLVRVC